MSKENSHPTKSKATNKPFADKPGRPHTPLQSYALATPDRKRPGNGPQTKHQHHYGKKR